MHTYDELESAINQRDSIDVDRISKEDFYDFLKHKDRRHMALEVDDFNTTYVLILLSKRSDSSVTVMHKKYHD